MEHRLHCLLDVLPLSLDRLIRLHHLLTLICDLLAALGKMAIALTLPLRNDRLRFGWECRPGISLRFGPAYRRIDGLYGFVFRRFVFRLGSFRYRLGFGFRLDRFGAVGSFGSAGSRGTKRPCSSRSGATGSAVPSRLPAFMRATAASSVSPVVNGRMVGMNLSYLV